MLRLLVNRVLFSIPLVLVVSVIVFALESLVPGDAARTILGENATPENVAALRQQLGLDDSWLERYWSWLTGLVHGDLGRSIFAGHSVTSELNVRLSVTASLLITALLVSAVLGIALGLLSAVRGGRLGRFVDAVSLLGLALPNFWVAIVVVDLFAVEARVFPAVGYTSLSESVGGWITSLTLPVCSLALLGIATIAKQTRDSALGVLESDYIRVLRANGVGHARIIGKHVLRNAAIPVVTVIGVVGVGMLGGSVFVENVFVLPGLGSLATESTTEHDLPVILGIAIYFTVLVIIINLLVDLAYGLLNPKVRTS